MSANLFGFGAKETFPEGLVNFELNDIERIVLKVLVLIDHPRSRTELKRLTESIVVSLPKYVNIRKQAVSRCIDSFFAKGLLETYNAGVALVPQRVYGILFAISTEKGLVDKVYKEFKLRTHSWQEDETKIKLAILSQNKEYLQKELSGSESYYYYSRDRDMKILSALYELGNLKFILPILPQMEVKHRDSFLSKLPFNLPYYFLDNLGDIMLSPEIKVLPYIKYNYLSCAHLVLPRKKVAGLTEKLNVPPQSLFFSELLAGNAEKALVLGAGFLEYMQELRGDKRKEMPGVYGLLYAIVIMANSSDLNLAATFIRSAKKNILTLGQEANSFQDFANILLMLVNHKLGKKTVTASEIRSKWECRINQHLLTAVMSWHGHPLKDVEIPDGVPEKEEMEFRAAGLRANNDSAAHSDKRLKELKNKFDMLPLAEFIGGEEAWENVLSILAASVKTSGGKSAKAVKAKRLIWLIDPMDERSLGAIEQTQNKAGWSKGQKRSLSALLKKTPEFASPEDIKVINCLGKSSYYYYYIEVKNWGNLMETLASHPHVYTLQEPHLPLEIRIQEAQIQVDKTGKGASIKLKPVSPGIKVIKESPTRYIYTKWPSKMLQIYQVLAEHGQTSVQIPQKGLAKAKPVIESISQSIPVSGSFVKASLTTKKSANIPVVQLTPVNEQLHVQFLVELVKDKQPLLVPGVGSSEIIMENASGKKINVIRDKEKEKGLLFALADKISWLQEMKVSSAQMFIDDGQCILDFLSDMKEKAPEVKIIWPKGERKKVARVISYADINVDVKHAGNWFELDGDVEVDEKLKFTIRQLLEKSQGGTLKYVQLDDKTYLTIQKDLQKRLAALNAVANPKGQKLEVHPLGTAGVERFIENVPGAKTDKKWQGHLKKLEETRTYRPSLPGNLKAELRPYQTDGVLWLDRLRHWGVGACLADDMGLGKTIQAIAMLLKNANNGPSLVIAPSSVCPNWKTEIIRFAPTLSASMLKNNKREETLETIGNSQVLIVSYGLVQSNPDLLAKRSWNIVVLDEAHAIKNPKSIRCKAVMKLDAKFKILTTGTPIQNHLGELWTLFNFMNPGMLGSFDQFNKKYMQGNGVSGQKEGRAALNRYISPFILRRNKNDVLDDLPEKTEITLHVSLSDEERAMYEVLREAAIEQINNRDNAGGARHMQILAEITRLRQMSCHPRLADPGSKLQSSKLDALDNLVGDLLDAGHKALVFSQFTKHLALIKQMLDKKGVSYQYLDGSTPSKKREEAINNFQNGQSDLFLISLKAGGVGLNLTAADYVIHMDPWWNPAIEDQASDRAHRIGQTRPVTIYRLIAENTIEEKIVKMHHEKRDLADKLLSDTDQSAKISSEELFELIVKGK